MIDTSEFWCFCRLIGKLEDFCSSGEFTTFLGTFANQHAAKFRFEDEEQPLECYQLWLNFKNHMDTKLDEFVAVQVAGLTVDQIMESLQRIQQVDDGLLSCIDYLMAAADYQDFVNLMLEMRGPLEEEDIPDVNTYLRQLADNQPGPSDDASHAEYEGDEE